MAGPGVSLGTNRNEISDYKKIVAFVSGAATLSFYTLVSMIFNWDQSFFSHPRNILEKNIPSNDTLCLRTVCDLFYFSLFFYSLSISYIILQWRNA